MKWSMALIFILLTSCFREPDGLSKEAPSQLINMYVAQTPSVTIKPRKLSKGEALYIRNCSDCHGWEGRGKGPAEAYIDIPVPILQSSKFVDEKSGQKFVDWVMYGSSAKLQLADKARTQTRSEVTSLLAYIRKLPAQDWEKISPGQVIYDELCAACHGLYGHGDGSFAAQMPVSLPDLSGEKYQRQDFWGHFWGPHF